MAKRADVRVSKTENGLFTAQVRNNGTFQFATAEDFRLQAEPKGVSATVIASVREAVVKPALEAEAAMPLGQTPGLEPFELVMDESSGIYLAKVGYQPESLTTMRSVPGATFDKDGGVWKVPVESRDALKPALQKVVEIQSDVSKGLEQAQQQAQQVIAAGRVKGLREDYTVSTRSFFQPEFVYAGEILASNKNGVAQLISVDSKANSAVVMIHDADRLETVPLVGDRVGIEYAKHGKATVEPETVARERIAERMFEKFDRTMGQEIAGVTVNEREGGYAVKFGFNPRMSAILQGLNTKQDIKVAFDSVTKSYSVDIDQQASKKALMYALTEMRQEFRDREQAKTELTRVAEELMSGAQVREATTKPGAYQVGRVVAENERFVLQSSGRNYFVLHEVGKLDQVPLKDQEVTITYAAGGKASVVEGRVPPKKEAALER